MIREDRGTHAGGVSLRTDATARIVGVGVVDVDVAVNGDVSDHDHDHVHDHGRGAKARLKDDTNEEINRD